MLTNNFKKQLYAQAVFKGKLRLQHNIIRKSWHWQGLKRSTAHHFLSEDVPTRPMQVGLVPEGFNKICKFVLYTFEGLIQVISSCSLSIEQTPHHLLRFFQFINFAPNNLLVGYIYLL